MNKKINFIYVSLIAAVTLTAFQNCTQGDFNLTENKTSQLPAQDSTSTTNNTGNNTTGDNSILQSSIIPKSIEKTVTPLVDILFVVDNSKSMSKEQAELGKKFPNFISNISNLDWKIAITTTSLSSNKTSFDPLLDGNLVYVNNSKNVISKGDTDAETDFLNAIQVGDTGSADERGIYASNLAIKKNDNKWMRQDAHLAIILISDEDERSTGINLEFYDLPDSLPSTVKQFLGTTKTSSFHSIIIRPGDDSCLKLQNDSSSAWGSGGNTGNTYANLTQLTNGILGNICSSDYGIQLTDIGKQIQNNIGRIKLECKPVIDTNHNIRISVNDIINSDLKFQINNDEIIFDAPVAIGSKIKVDYFCSSN